MLPENAKELMDRVVNNVLASRAEVLRSEINSAAGWALQAGIGGSQIAANKRAMVHYDQLERLANQVWIEIKRVLEEIQVAPSEGFNQDLKNYFDSKLAAPLKECEAGARESLEFFDTKPNPSIEHHYQVVRRRIFAEMDLFCAKVEVRASEKKANRMNPNVIYNLHGDNPRVVINSQDYSINIANSKVVFDEMRKAINSQIPDEELKEGLLVKVTEMEKCIGKNTFLNKYSEFVALAANHMTVFGPFLPALTNFLQNVAK